MRNQNPSGSDDVTLTITLEHAFQEKKSQSQNSIQQFEFPALCSALLGLPFCPPGAIARLPASTEKSARKFKMLYRVLNLRFFFLLN